MANLNIGDNEKRCLHILAKHFLQGDVEQQGFREVLQNEQFDFGGGEDGYRALMMLMEEHGAIVEPSHVAAPFGFYSTFTIAPKAVLLVRELDELERKANEPGDLVSRTLEKSRGNPYTAALIIGSIVLAAVLTIVNQSAQLLTTLGVIKPAATKADETQPKDQKDK